MTDYKRVTTEQELDALPVGSVIRIENADSESNAANMRVSERGSDGWGFIGYDPEFTSAQMAVDCLPALVLWEPVRDPEPAYPEACEHCGVSYDLCTYRLRRTGKCCCPSCFQTATHNQDAWETWDRRRKGLR